MDFVIGNNVEFREGSGPVAVTVTITEDVAPSSILFDDTNADTTTFTINASDPAHEIVSTQGDVNSTNSGILRITMFDSGTINAGLNGRFEIRGDETLTLGGVSASLLQLTVEEDLDLVVAATGNLSGLIDMDDGDLVINGTVATVDAATGTTVRVNAGGEISVFLSNRGNATIDGQVDDVTNFGGATTDLNAGGEITGLFTNAGIATVAGNVGTLDNNGQLTFDGSMTVGTGGFTNDGGTARILTGVTVTAETEINGGTVTVDSGGLLQGDVDVLTSGVLVVNGEVVGNVTSDNDVTVVGTVTGDITNQANGELDSTGTITGTLTNTGDAEIAGSLGALTNNSGGNVDIDGAATITGLVDNSGDLDVLSGFLLTATGGVENDGTIDLSANASIAGAVTNRATRTITMETGSSLTGGLTNEGTLRVNGTASVDTLDSSGTISLSNGSTADELNVTGNATLNGEIRLDIDLREGSLGSDLLVISGAASGNVILTFNQLGSGSGPLTTPITVMSFGPGSTLTVQGQGLISLGAFIYQLDTTVVPGEVNVISFANPDAAAVAGTVTLTQSLIGSVINRPSSPFVTGLASESDRACRPGVWARAIGGKAKVTGSTETPDTAGNRRVFKSRVEATYGGIQIGGDFSCFDEPIAGWDVSLGGILGVNTGSTVQPLEATPTAGGGGPGIVVSTNFTDFGQTYAGVYVSAVKDRLLLDLQYRVEKTTYDLRNDGLGGARIGIIDQEFDSKGQTVSGSLSYIFPVNKEMGISFVPTAGFAITKYKTDAIEREDGGLNIDDGSIEVGFIGAALSKTNILPSGNAALTYFATGTYYKDFADPLRSEVVGTAAVAGSDVFSSNLGQYGELSLGVNYTQLLEPGNAVLNAKQMNASVRLDGRFGDTLDSWGVTAQVRLQF